MLNAVIPSLKVEGLAISPNSVGFDLSLFLYKGAASLDRLHVMPKIEAGQLGPPIMERLPLLEAIHKRWQDSVVAKRLSRATIAGEWGALKDFVAFLDRTAECTTGNVDRLYLRWAADLAVRGSSNAETKYDASMKLARAISVVTTLDARRLQWKTKLRKPRALGARSAKENLNETAAFIQLMHQTIEQLPVDVVRGPLPVLLRFGEVHYEIHCTFGRLKPIESLKNKTPFFLKRAEERRSRHSRDTSNTKRAMLINLRLEAEMLIFINQTSANLTQALQLTGGKFRYQSKGDFVYVRPWKKRANHAVEFRIEKAYRRYFETFLKWREAIFPGDPDGLTFPFVTNHGDMAMQRTGWAFEQVRRLCKSLGKPFVHSMQHRKTAGNFVNRRVDRQTASELLSNDVKTFQQNYEEVDHQRAAAELVRFWGLMGVVRGAVGPGGCEKAEHELVPEQVAGAPRGAPKPDCEGGSGCLFCPKNRDLRSFDHAWNLASLQHLALFQLTADHTDLSLEADHPSRVTAERAVAKLEAMAALDEECSAWVAEARLRVQEGRYHPHYTHKFESLEGAA